MKNLISFLIFLLFAWLGIWWYYSCDWCKKEVNKDSIIVQDKTDPEAEALAKKAYDDSIMAVKLANGLFAKDHLGEDVFRYPDNLRINNADGNVFIPEAISDFSTKVAEYLGTHQDQEILILGYENAPETKNPDSLGISRAEYIKNILVNAGINADRIVTKSTLEEYSYDTEGIYYGGIGLKFNILDESRLVEVEKSIANRTLYSNFGEKTFKPDATLSNYSLELKNYLQKYPEKSVRIIGHTDDVGSTESNLWYGQERANNVKTYLISQGIDKTRLQATSQGESNPVVPNTTEENKAKNRRIEIKVN
ncbi:OmpA family protein [Aquimarina pacifica]|uniref:OmpA family protein n=1 Tax=Aquimarina pacifica TaxID=1296415 RepID=UPI00046E89A0|nr:OmpA family protein [Aquimarina pacifica]